MIIKDIFEKKIDRDIRGVIKVDKGTGTTENEVSEREALEKQELEEYVADCVNSHLENIEFMLYGDLDVNAAINRTGVALEVSYNITRKSAYDIYSMVIKYN